MYNSGDFYGALSEILNVDIDIIDLLQPEMFENTGSSSEEWHYGYYFEFPKFEEFEELDEEVRKEILNKILPFGENVYLSDGEFSDTLSDPLGWRDDILEIEYYQKNILPQEKILSELDLIRDKIMSNPDGLIKKSLIFSAFSLTESYIKSYVWGQIPSLENNILDERLQKIVYDSLSYRFSKEDDRNKILKSMQKKQLKKIPEWNIRNVLSHDIGEVDISGDILRGKDMKNKDFSENIYVLLDKLREYVQEPLK
ncbi:hypothetical protein FAE16_000445 [Enterococcus faecium]|uniref:hypothetical protein n=1 Tax=Enterococcus faecium TaxID=1352 RepID=UPI001122A00B|nr:hypothetical protein [Enterococcus faecium]EGP4971644.1 hypothetical protein [Enterococcus faecium]MDQ8526715.1 hypothetical protein [Enterococcus faecium]MDT6276046.1 hypothetical protein [Enterococcus faecium]TNX45491.1 hypothetical protein FIU39_03905 [Enterococcus faecium]HAQ3894755.1 hypothetical protein [Enterococcus faecium]